MTRGEFILYAIVIVLVSLLLSALNKVSDTQSTMQKQQESILKKQDAILYLLETASIKQLPDEK